MSILFAKGLLIVIQVLFITRFHLELSKINSFIEPVNTIRRLTNPVVLPLKRLLPGTWGKRLAAMFAALLLSMLIVLLFNQQGLYNAFVNALLLTLSTWISFLQYGMFLFVIGSWIQVDALQRVNYFLHHIFEPMLRPIKQILPGFGGLDFSPIVFLLGLSFLSPIVFNFLARLLT